MYFGGTQGFNRFNPKDINKNPLPPLSIELIELQVNGNINTEFGNIGELDSLILDPQQNTFTLKYAAIDYLSNGENQYQVFLKGFEKDWQKVGNKNSIRYTKVPSGEYVFQIKAANNDGIWMEGTKTLFIKILTPWYQSSLAYLLYISVLGILFYAIYNFRRKRRQLQLQLKLEQQEAEQLKELDHFKNTFFTNITHEFRTPLTVIQGMSAELKGNEKAKRLIQRNSHQLLELINQLLDLSKIESGSMPMNWVQTDIINYLNYLTESLQSFAFSKKISLAFYSELDALKMDIDEEKLQTIIINLISNGIKFTPEYGKILIIGNKKEVNGKPIFQLKISDTGKGIPKNDLPKIFDRFFQVDRSNKNVGQGTGIGLALVKELTEMHNGTIEVESQEEKGTTFTLNFPISQNASMSDASLNNTFTKFPSNEITPTFSLASSAIPTGSNELPNLLIIEDNYDVIQYLQTILQNNFNITIAKNGSTGIEKALLEIPDIIISDVMMPKKDGFEVCETLKQNELTSHIPIILLTAKATSKDKIQGLQFGADAYLMKPFHKEELLVRLEKLLELRTNLQEKYSNFSFQKSTASPLSLEAQFLQKINKTIEENLSDENFTTPFLCKKMGMSNSQLYRKLKAVTGFSIANYIRHRRLQHAHHLLETTPQTISDIAFHCGFSNLSWFTQAFKDVFGYSPKELRN